MQDLALVPLTPRTAPLQLGTRLEHTPFCHRDLEAEAIELADETRGLASLDLPQK